MVNAPMEFVQSWWNRVALRRADLLGREQGQALVRVVLTMTVLGYYLVQQGAQRFNSGMPEWLYVLFGFLLFSVAVAAAALYDRHSRHYRRVVTNIVDVAMITYLMVRTGEVGAPLFVIYLWVTLGNGFRFGLAAMTLSAILSVTGFVIVMLNVDLWRQYTALSVGVIIGLVVLPTYAAHLIRQLHRARELAEEASSAKSQFLARMSHELRTPLNGVLGTADLLGNNRRLTAADRELLGVIKESISVSLRQIDGVLDFSRIEAGKLVLDQSEFDLHQVLHSAVRMVNPAALERHLRLLVRISPQAPYLLIGDAHHLREILINLLSNAIKFTHTGYVSLQVDPISIADDSVRLRFEIRDTGIGIAPEALGRIWESFTQEDSGTNRRYGGTGLGTTIAKQLVELMGGKIAVSSIKGRGAVFWCDLRFRRAAGKLAHTIPGARILALTKDPEMKQALQGICARFPGSMTTTPNVTETVGVLARGIRLGQPWHLILVDEDLAVAPGNRHRADELASKALAVQTPLYLVTDTPHEVERLCEWGYAGVMPRLPDAAMLATAVHASPQYDAHADDAAVVHVEPWAWRRESRRAARILVADDNRINRMILEEMLVSAGYEADVVNDGETALRRLTTGHYQAAVLDLHMPGLDGDDLIRRYRLLKAGARIPIIMLTADITFDAKSDCADAGADAFLTKPVTAEKLLSTLERLMRERQVRNLPVPEPDDEEAPDETNIPVLDGAVLAELNRLCRDPSMILTVIDTFENEGETLLTRIAETVAERNHSAYTERVRALENNAMSIGALQLTAACRRTGAAGVLDFRQRGAQRLHELGEHLKAVRLALYTLRQQLANPGTTGKT